MALDANRSPALESLGRAFANGTKFIVWLGSGTSIAAGLPSWPILRSKLGAVLDTRAKRADAPHNLRAIAETAAKLPDHWNAFEVLKAQLKSDYVRRVKEALATDGINPPSQLTRIWSNPNIDGMISLNLDDLALKAFNEKYAGRQTVAHTDGTNLRLALRLLNESASFLVQLHGALAEEKSWVLTTSERETLVQDPLYQRFVDACLTGRKILFIGCSPDDIAVKLHFDRMKATGGYMPEHFWLVSAQELTEDRRRDLDEMNVGLIEYDVSDPNISSQHLGAITSLFDYVETTQFEDPLSGPINPLTRPITERLPPERVQAMQPEQARNILSGYASAILEIADKEERERNYTAFLREYAAAINVASTVHREPGAIFFGMKFEEKIGEGAFAHVWRARGKDGTSEKAIKLVHKQVADDASRLNSFRTGVKSMRILSSRGVDGMVTYDGAHEIPPCVIMPFLHGENLETAARRPSFCLDTDGISVARRVAEIVKAAHDLPERVLHRDIRPANVIIRAPQFAEESLAERVVVLDFDLSWHEGAEQDNAVSQHMATVLSYLAPEQLKDSNSSRRHAKVDTYGLCMTLMFLGRREHPEPHLRRSTDWHPTLSTLGSGVRLKWTSWLPRLRRLVDLGTTTEQAERSDFSDVVQELKALEVLARISLDNVDAIDALPLEAIAEELFCQIVRSDRYTWTPKTRTGFYQAIEGINAELSESSRGSERSYTLTLRRQQKGYEKFSEFEKFWLPRLQQFHSIMKRGGWDSQANSNSHARDVALSFFITEESLRTAPASAAKAAKEVWSVLTSK